MGRKWVYGRLPVFLALMTYLPTYLPTCPRSVPILYGESRWKSPSSTDPTVCIPSSQDKCSSNIVLSVLRRVYS
ncbi:uncharacterized protein GGS25DRAFT_469562 [Hypoxylon fragiforme]|uniref:uncharacterized protein n=1 Tax=Hypoxylon fragiforme TaxID=63214 RepID=UPI0020C63F87|nr:uncharacterized protein GGS25DRAFT_469562 [Hypoxylon fragiforme]KAI2613910.1 hypothetical protein GGS25DRAFT_469562 [Hypoxylon fragiforme]